MGLLDDIKNMKPVSNKVFTVSDLIKVFNKVPFSNKGNKNIKRYRNSQSNYQMNVDIGKGDDSTIIKCPNEVKITIDKSNENNKEVGVNKLNNNDVNEEVSEIRQKIDDIIKTAINENSKDTGVNEGVY